MNKYMNMNNKNMSRKNGTLKWVGLVELIMGALNLSNGLLSVHVCPVLTGPGSAG